MGLKKFHILEKNFYPKQLRIMKVQLFQPIKYFIFVACFISLSSFQFPSQYRGISINNLFPFLSHLKVAWTWRKKLFSHESPQLADTKWGVFWNFLSTFKMVVSRDLLRFFIVPITNIKMNKLVQSLFLPLTYLTLSVFPSRRRTLVRIYSNQFKNGFNIIILYLLIKMWKKEWDQWVPFY